MHDILPQFVSALRALGAAHEKGLIHKALTPENLWFDSTKTASETLRIGDLEIGYWLQQWRELLDGHEQEENRPSYRAPELITEQAVTASVDVYQMGLILVETLTGDAVVRHSQTEAADRQHAEGDIRVPQGLMSSPLGPIIQIALAPEVSERFPSALDFADALEKISATPLPAFSKEDLRVPLSASASTLLMVAPPRQTKEAQEPAEQKESQAPIESEHEPQRKKTDEQFSGALRQLYESSEQIPVADPSEVDDLFEPTGLAHSQMFVSAKDRFIAQDVFRLSPVQKMIGDEQWSHPWRPSG